jgi:hypothetical protein
MKIATVNHMTDEPKPKPKRSSKLSLYPLTLEDAIRAAAKTGRPPSDKPKRAKQETKADDQNLAERKR